MRNPKQNHILFARRQNNKRARPSFPSFVSSTRGHVRVHIPSREKNTKLFIARYYYYCCYYSPARWIFIFIFQPICSTDNISRKAWRLCHVRYPNSFSRFHDFSSSRFRPSPQIPVDFGFPFWVGTSALCSYPPIN